MSVDKRLSAVFFAGDNQLSASFFAGENQLSAEIGSYILFKF